VDKFIFADAGEKSTISCGLEFRATRFRNRQKTELQTNQGRLDEIRMAPAIQD